MLESLNSKDIYIPERTTKSFRSRPLSVNLAAILSRGSNGEGNCSFAASSLADSPSRRPSKTGQNGPPACKARKENFICLYYNTFK